MSEKQRDNEKKGRRSATHRDLQRISVFQVVIRTFFVDHSLHQNKMKYTFKDLKKRKKKKKKFQHTNY